MTDLIRLAEMVEALTRPDREVDAVIHKAIHQALADMSVGDGWIFGGDHSNPVQAPAYTASLDAAMTLVPGGLAFGCGSRDATNTSWAWVGKHDGEICAPNTKTSNSATPALALTAAALRSLAARRGQS